MKIDNTLPSFKANPIKVLPANNSHKKYLYNEVIDLVKKHQVSAVFSNKEINVLSPTKVFVENLKEIGIKFDKMA